MEVDFVHLSFSFRTLHLSYTDPVKGHSFRTACVTVTRTNLVARTVVSKQLDSQTYCMAPSEYVATLSQK